MQLPLIAPGRPCATGSDPRQLFSQASELSPKGTKYVNPSGIKHLASAFYGFKT